MNSKNKQLKAQTGKTAKIVVVDDHPIVRQGLTQQINQEPDLVVCDQAGDAYQAMRCIEKSRPDLAIIDISLKDTSGIELIKNIRANDSSMPILVLSMHDESIYAERCLRAGANGYIMKERASEEIIGAIRQVLANGIYLSDTVTNKVIRKTIAGRTNMNSSLIDSLSDRELEVFRLIGQGVGTRQIAEKLYLSIKTIESYRAHIKEKLVLSNAVELAQRAIQWVNSENTT